MVFQELFLRQRRLDAALNKIDQTMDYAIDVDVPDENIVRPYGWKKSMS